MNPVTRLARLREYIKERKRSITVLKSDIVFLSNYDQHMALCGTTQPQNPIAFPKPDALVNLIPPQKPGALVNLIPPQKPGALVNLIPPQKPGALVNLIPPKKPGALVNPGGRIVIVDELIGKPLQTVYAIATTGKLPTESMNTFDILKSFVLFAIYIAIFRYFWKKYKF
jgi:hypothetical protein